MIVRKRLVSLRTTEKEYDELLRLAEKYAPTVEGKPNVSAYVRKCVFERPEAFVNRKMELSAARLLIRKAKAKLHRIIAFDEAGVCSGDIKEVENILSEVQEVLRGEKENGNDDDQ